MNATPASCSMRCDELKAPATFFVVGDQAMREPESGQARGAEGHLVGNHSFTHPHMDT